MSRIRPRTASVLAFLALALAVAIALGVAAGVGAAARTCTAAQAAVTIDGVRTCRSVRTVAPIRTQVSDATFVAQRVVGTGGVAFPMPRLKTGSGRLGASYTKAQAARIVATARAVEAAGLAAAVNAMAEKAARGSRPAGTSRPRAHARVDAPAGVTIGAPELTSTATSASVKISASASDGQGGKIDVKAAISAQLEADGNATASVSLEVSSTRAGVTTSSHGGGNILGTKADYCPSAKGVIRYSEPYRVTSGGTTSERIGAIDLGSISRSQVSTGNVTGTAQMTAEAALAPIPFKVSLSSSFTASGTGVGKLLGSITGSLYAINATATGSGSINPKTGAVMANSRWDVRLGGSGGSPKDRASVAKAALDEARALVGKQYAHVKDVEARAREGKCTYVQFTPDSGAELAPGETKGVQATIRTRADNIVLGKPVLWTATASRGTVAPPTGNVNSFDTKVTGAAPQAGTTASVTYKAVSPAGISTKVWTGVDSPFPKTYSGSIDYTWTIGGATESSAANVTYTLESSKTNPDGSKQAWYEASAQEVTSMGFVPSGCWAYGPTAPGAPQTRKAGDLEIVVDPQGNWQAGALLDVDLGSKTILSSCPPPFLPYSADLKFVFNTRTLEGTSNRLRPMPAKGAIIGTGVTDAMTFVAASSGSANWNLQPAG